MVMEIVGATKFGKLSEFGIVEFDNIWDSSLDTWSVTESSFSIGTISKGLVSMTSYDTDDTSGNVLSADLLPYINRGMISFSGFCSTAAGTGALQPIGGNGNTVVSYIRLTDGVNNQNIIYTSSTATTSCIGDDLAWSAANSVASANFNIVKNGNILKIYVGSVANNGTNSETDNGGSATATVSNTIFTNENTVDISSWTSLKIQLVTSNTESNNNPGAAHAIASISPILFTNTAIGSKKTITQ